MLKRLSHRFTGSVLVWDIFLTLLCLHFAATIRLELEFGRDLIHSQVQLPWSLYLVVGVIWLISFLLIAPQRAVFRGGLLETVGRLVAAVALAALTFAGMLYLSFRDVSRLQFLYFAAIDLAALLILHVTVHSYVHFRQRNGWQRRVLIVGGRKIAHQLAHELQRNPWTGIQVVGCTCDEAMEDHTMTWLGDIPDTPRIITEQQINDVIFTLPPQRHDEIARLSLQLHQLPVMIHMVPSVLDLTFSRTAAETIGGVPLISLRESALSEPQRIFKRLFDMSASALLLTLLAPLMLLIALLIKLESPGPIFFLQERIGEHGKRFKMIKFRSMYQDADRRWREVARRDESGRLIHKASDDPRITCVGRKLRRTSLDELPQLFNVLKGEMSLVGPRPEMPYIAAEYELWQWKRFQVPPGITGWWQVNGRSDKPMHLHTEDDLYYIQNYSFWLDLQILFKTISVVFSGHGAY